MATDEERRTAQCLCGGTVEMKDDLLVCDRCGLGASVPMTLSGMALMAEHFGNLPMRRAARIAAETSDEPMTFGELRKRMGSPGLQMAPPTLPSRWHKRLRNVVDLQRAREPGEQIGGVDRAIYSGRRAEAFCRDLLAAIEGWDPDLGPRGHG